MWSSFPNFFPSIIISMANAVGSQAQNRADFFIFLCNLLKLIAFFYTAAFFGLLGHIEDSLIASQTILSMRSLWFLRIFFVKFYDFVRLFWLRKLLTSNAFSNNWEVSVAADCATIVLITNLIPLLFHKKLIFGISSFWFRLMHLPRLDRVSLQ